MEGKCIVSSCGKAASKCCGSCGVIRYCSVECQKDDWKKHHKKAECVNMKILSTVSLTEKEMSTVTDKISSMCGRLKTIGEGGRIIHLLREFIAFVRDRLGRLDSEDSRSLIRVGVRLNHLIICRLLVKLGIIYFDMQTSFENDSHVISCLSEARELLVERIDTGMDEIVAAQMLMGCDTYLYLIHEQRGQIEKAKYHSEQCVATARRYKGRDQVDRLKHALSLLSHFCLSQSKYPEALAVAEEAYIVASKQYSPAHEIVLQASRQMINCLIAMGNYSTADTYSRMNYANLIDPKNAEEYSLGEKIEIMNQLANVWLCKEPGDDDEIIEKALADEAIDLSRKAYELVQNLDCKRNDKNYLIFFFEVLLKANQLTEETEGILHLLVTACIVEYNSNGNSMCKPFEDLGRFYIKLHESLPLGEGSILVQENMELCNTRLFELESCNDGSIGYIKGSQKIQPYFKNNVGLCI